MPYKGSSLWKIRQAVGSKSRVDMKNLPENCSVQTFSAMEMYFQYMKTNLVSVN